MQVLYRWISPIGKLCTASPTVPPIERTKHESFGWKPCIFTRNAGIKLLRSKSFVFHHRPLWHARGAWLITNISVASLSGPTRAGVNTAPSADGGYPHYGAAKAAIAHYTRYLAPALGPWDHPNCIAPGVIATGRISRRSFRAAARATAIGITRWLGGGIWWRRERIPAVETALLLYKEYTFRLYSERAH